MSDFPSPLKSPTFTSTQVTLGFQVAHRVVLNDAPGPLSPNGTPATLRLSHASMHNIHDLTVEIEHLRTQLAQGRALHKAAPPSANPSSSHLTKLESIADMARAGLAEELRIQKKAEPTLQEAILILDREDFIPVRWLPLKRALQSLQGVPRLEPKRTRR